MSDDDFIGETLSTPCPECGDFDCLRERTPAPDGRKRAKCDACGCEVVEDTAPMVPEARAVSDERWTIWVKDGAPVQGTRGARACELVEVVPASRLAEVEAAHQARFALITKHYAELAAERDRLRAALAYLADEESWIGGVQDEPLVYGHDQPWEIARVALNPPKEVRGGG